ncbi:MAG: prepilin-type N-terminal cleavage/methylation domain-containing protein, partial [Gammaproteobacteria bacterium]|nr:prepilin-type N-terminal cleavage/methylation domain-containing protein [Gammaproteobacteria bacterium]
MTRVKGFTLVELMVVIALLTIIATVAIPSLSTLMRDNRTEAQAEELNALLQYARSEAVTRKTPTEVTVDTSNGEVEVKSGGTLLRTSTINLDHSTLSVSVASVGYYPNGTANTPDFQALLC